MAKIPRNAPCPCGSGKKYKKCCLPSRRNRVDPETLARIAEHAEANFEREKRRREKYGYVRPVISTTVKGYRLVVVASTVHYSKSWRTVPDFLFYYIKTVLGGKWGTKEIRTKPLADRHPILQWYDSVCRFQRRHMVGKSEDGLYGGEMDGPTAAYLLLAYDLYVLADHQRLQERLIKRLKHPDQFQGARYELSVATHCIRVGFEIDHEDEEDTAKQHPEFIATHKESGQAVAVEAKSRHRPGVLGFPGEKQENPKAGVRAIVSRALAKPVELPYAVFIDLNLPPTEVDDIRELAWFRELVDDVQRLAEDEPHPYNVLMFTNYPEHYGVEAAKRPGSDRVSLVSLKPKTVVDHPEALEALHEAAFQYGRVPNWFEEEPIRA